MLFDSQKQEVIIIAVTDKVAVAKIIEELQKNDFYHFKFAVNGAEIYKITRTYYENPDSIGLIIVSEDLPDCQIKELCLSFSHDDGGVFIPVIVLQKELYSDDDRKLDSRHLIYHLKEHYSPIEMQITADFLICLKNEKYLRYKQQKRLLTELAERKLIDAKLQYLSAHDQLTGLLNRSSLEQHIQLTLNRNSNRSFSQDSSLYSTLLFIDLDRFSLLNELEGFDAGDRLLIEIISLIRSSLNNTGLFARIDSDKFGLYLENIPLKQATILSDNIKIALDNFRFVIGTIAYNITTSIGFSSFNFINPIQHPQELISQAHQACCIAKTYGGNTVWKYDIEDSAVKKRHRDIYWVPIIRDALIKKNFFLVFQPVVNLNNGEVSHYEVLIRLRDTDGTVIGPSEFIPAAERMGLIHGIDLWVVESAIDYLAALPIDRSHIALAINLSSVAFKDASLLPMIKQKLEMTGIRGERLTFEITETAAVENYEEIRSMINHIRALGCRFALDDFGAGFCSFNYLKNFPVDYVKIDGQFIQNLAKDETDQMLVLAMQQIVKKMGKKTIAEFVECPKTIKILRDMGINYGQGYIFGKPSEHLLERNVIQSEDITAINPEFSNAILPIQ